MFLSDFKQKETEVFQNEIKKINCKRRENVFVFLAPVWYDPGRLRSGNEDTFQYLTQATTSANRTSELQITYCRLQKIMQKP
jgi:hypothetical protein